MAKLIELAVERAMISHAVYADPWTYAEMCRVEVMMTRPLAHEPRGRIADKIQQRWRRKGWAQFTRIGRNTFWTLTAAGRAALSPDTQEAEHGRE